MKHKAFDQSMIYPCFIILMHSVIKRILYFKARVFQVYDKALEDAITKLQEVKDISEKDIKEITQEIRHLGALVLHIG